MTIVERSKTTQNHLQCMRKLLRLQYSVYIQIHPDMNVYNTFMRCGCLLFCPDQTSGPIQRLNIDIATQHTFKYKCMFVRTQTHTLSTATLYQYESVIIV